MKSGKRRVGGKAQRPIWMSSGILDCFCIITPFWESRNEEHAECPSVRHLRDSLFCLEPSFRCIPRQRRRGIGAVRSLSALLCLVDELAQRLEHMVSINGLGQMRVHPRLHGALHVLVEGIGRQRDDWDALRVFPLPPPRRPASCRWTGWYRSSAILSRPCRIESSAAPRSRAASPRQRC